jgi:hypothetical protein
MNTALVDALRHNRSLVSVEYRGFTDAQRDRIQSYCTRNQGISNLIAELCESDTAEEVSRRKVGRAGFQLFQRPLRVFGIRIEWQLGDSSKA